MQMDSNVRQMLFGHPAVNVTAGAAVTTLLVQLMKKGMPEIRGGWAVAVTAVTSFVLVAGIGHLCACALAMPGVWDGKAYWGTLLSEGVVDQALGVFAAAAAMHGWSKLFAVRSEQAGGEPYLDEVYRRGTLSIKPNLLNTTPNDPQVKLRP